MKQKEASRGLVPVAFRDPIDHLRDDQIERYARHLVLPEIGAQGQLDFLATSIAVIGCGALGANAALCLAQAGVGSLYLYDSDVVEISNLHRQPFTLDQVGMPKVEALANLCQARNPDVHVRAFIRVFDGDDAPIWMDCTDTDASRRHIDILRGGETDLIFGAVTGMDAQVSMFAAGQVGFRILFPDPIEPNHRLTCAEQGVFGPLAHLTAQIMVAEALKVSQGVESVLQNQLLLIDARDWRFSYFKKPVSGI